MEPNNYRQGPGPPGPRPGRLGPARAAGAMGVMLLGQCPRDGRRFLMHRWLDRVLAGAAAGAVLCAAGAAGGATAASAARQPPDAPHAVTAAGRIPPGPVAQVWLKRFHGPGDAGNVAHAMAVSPDGGTVYVTGTSLVAAS